MLTSTNCKLKACANKHTLNYAVVDAKGMNGAISRMQAMAESAHSIRFKAGTYVIKVKNELQNSEVVAFSGHSNYLKSIRTSEIEKYKLILF